MTDLWRVKDWFKSCVDLWIECTVMEKEGKPSDQILRQTELD